MEPVGRSPLDGDGHRACRRRRRFRRESRHRGSHRRSRRARALARRLRAQWRSACAGPASSRRCCATRSTSFSATRARRWPDWAIDDVLVEPKKAGRRKA
jgi:hypothetical protein